MYKKGASIWNYETSKNSGLWHSGLRSNKDNSCLQSEAMESQD